MRVFIGGAYNDKERLQEISQLLMHKGHNVSNNWMHWEPDYDNNDIANIKRVGAQLDTRDLKDSDVVVIFTDVPSTTGGWFVELGMALAWRKLIILVGEFCTPCVYFHHPTIRRCITTWTNEGLIHMIDDLKWEL